jgi:hypothetical protein
MTPKSVALTIIEHAKKKAQTGASSLASKLAEDSVESDDPREGRMSAVEDMFSAIDSRDASALDDALQAYFELCR